MIINMIFGLQVEGIQTGRMVVSGEADEDLYERIASGVLYSETDPIQPIYLDKMITFTLSDNANFSNSTSVSLSIINVNDKPNITLVTTTVQFDELEGAPVQLFNGAVEDVDPGPDILAWATVTITPVVDPNDTLIYNDTGYSVSSTSVEQSLNISLLTNTSQTAERLSKVSFYNPAGNLNQSSRTIQFVISDGEEESEPAVVTVMIVPFDDSPICYFGNEVSVL